jgi:hypothetical protein
MTKELDPKSHRQVDILMAVDIPDAASFRPLCNNRVNDVLQPGSKARNRPAVCQVVPVLFPLFS